MSFNRRNNPPQDDLLERYSQAKAELPDGLPDAPSAAVRERIMQAAREQIHAMNTIASRAYSMPANGLKDIENQTENVILTAAAANDSFWNIRALGSLAVMGLAGLLWWQFEHGTPNEQEAARSAKPSSAIVATAPTTTPATASTSTSATESIAPLAAPLPPAADAPTKLAQAKSATQTSSKELAEITTPSPTRELPPAIASAAQQIPAPSAPQPAAASAPAPTAKPLPQAEKASADATVSGIHDAAPHTRSTPSASSPAAVATAPRIMAAPAPAARALIASPDQLFRAINAKDATALRDALTQGASPNARMRAPEGPPALQQAVIQRWLDGVRILLAAGADRNAKNNKGHTAADVALELGYSDMAELLATQK